MKSWRAGVLAVSIAFLFLAQFATAIPPGELPVPLIPSPPLPRPPDEEGWLCLNRDDLRFSATFSYDFYATNNSWVMARIDGCDATDITVKEGSNVIQRFTAYPGIDLCAPLWFSNETWLDGHPSEGACARYTVEIDPARAQYFSMLAVLPQVLAQGNATVNKTAWYEAPFLAAGRVFFLFDGNFSVTDFSAQILPAGSADPLWLKRDDYPGAEQCPMNFSAVAATVQGNRYLQMSADLPAERYILQVKGAGSVEWVILADGDNDQDGLSDVTEVQQDLDLAMPDVWGYRTVTGATEALQDLSDALAAGNYGVLVTSWQLVTLNLYIPVAVGAIPIHAAADNGHFENFTIDGDPFVGGNVTLDGFQGTGENPIQFYDNESHWRSAPEWQFTYPDTRFLAILGTGSHAISFMQRENPLDPPLISFFSPMYPITELGQQRAGNPAVDSDNDGLDDGMDREVLNSLQWLPGTALRLAIPYTYEDRQDQADLQVTFSVAPPAHDYTTRAAPVAWHLGEGTDGAGVKCHIVPVMRCYGVGPTGRADYWYKNPSWEQFWGKTVTAQSLVGVDANGKSYDALTTGFSFLPAPTNETSDPDKGDPASGYTYFLYPEQANKSWAYTLRIPRDHPLLQNASKIPAITFDFAWQVLEENPNNGTLSLAHIYDCLDNVMIQSAVAFYTATAGNGALRYVLGKPESHAEYVALQALSENPGCEVIQSPGARPITESIVKIEQGVGLLPMYHYDKDNLTTLSIADRIAHWREEYPRNPGDSEVVFYCGKEKTILLLQELAADVFYDCYADPAGIPGGEIQYADVPATWSFGGVGDDTWVKNVGHTSNGGPWDGSPNAQVVARNRHFAKVLYLHPIKDDYSGWIPAWASVDAGAPAGNASVEFWLVLGHKADQNAPNGVFDIKLTNASGTIGPWLRFDGERMEYGRKNPTTGETEFTTLDDVAVWPDEPIRVSIWYNCTNGSFFIDLGGAAYNLQNFVPFHDPANNPKTLQMVNFTAKYVDACIDAVGLTQAPRGTGDCGGAAYNRSNNAVDYAAWHAGDEERFVAWTQISNVSQDEIPPKQLLGDYSVLWEKSYREVIHSREEIELYDVPLQVKFTRASDRNDDALENTNYVEVTTARGFTQAGNVPQRINDIQAVSIADEEIYFNHQVTNERVTCIALNDPPLVQFDDALDTYFEEEDYRQTEVDWWEHFYRPGSMRLSDLTWMKIREVIEHFFESDWQEVRQSLPVRIRDIVNHIFDVEELAQAACVAAGVSYLPPQWTWDLVLPGNGFWFVPGFYGLDVQNGQLTGSIFNQLGVAVRRPSTNPGAFWVQAAQLGPGLIVQLANNKVAFRRIINLENLPEFVTRVTNAIEFVERCHLAQLKGTSVPLLVWAKLKDSFTGIDGKIWQNIKQQIEPLLKDGSLTRQEFVGLDILQKNGITSVEQLFEPVKITGAMQDGLAPYPEFALVLPVKMTRALLAKVNKAAATTKEYGEIVPSYPGKPNQQHIGNLFNIPAGTPRDGASLASGINWGKRAVLPDHVLVELWKAWGPDAVEIERQLAFLELCIDGTKDKHGNILQPGYADIPLALPGAPTRGAFMANLPSGYWPSMTMLDQWHILTGKTGFNDVLAGYFGAPHRLAGYADMNYDLLCQRALWFNPNAFGSQNNPLRAKNTPSGALPQNVRTDPLYRHWQGVRKNVEFSTPRQERVLEKWRHRVEYFQELYYSAGGDALSSAEFEVIAQDIARTLVEDISLGLMVDDAGIINFLKYYRNPALLTMMRIMEEGYWESQLNRVDRIFSLKKIFGEKYADALIARAKELIPSFAGAAKKVAAKILEQKRNWIGAWPGGAKMSGPEFLAIQYSLSDFNLEMLAAGPDFNWEHYYEFLEHAYGPGLKGWGPMGGGLPLYKVMEFTTEKSVKIYMKTMAWDLDYAYSILMQWRAVHLRAFMDVPALPNAGYASKNMLMEHGMEALQDDLFALEVSKTTQKYAIVEPARSFPSTVEGDPWAGYWSFETYLAGKMPIGEWVEYFEIYYNSQLIYKTWSTLEVIYSYPACKSIWDSRGMNALLRFLPAVFIDLLQRIPVMITDVEERTALGQPATKAWTDVLIRDVVPILITALVDVYVVDALLASAGLVATATTAFWEGIALNALAWAAAMVTLYVVSTLWYTAWANQEQYMADVLTELNLGGAQEWVFPAATNASIARHGGLEVGDVVTLKTTVENRGTRKYQDQGFFNYQPLDGDGASEGSPFWYQARYCIQGSSGWSDWNGSWSDDQLLYPYREYYGWLLGLFEKDEPRSPPVVRYYSFTLAQACASPTLASEFQVASQFHTRTKHDVQTSSQIMSDFHVMEQSITEFMARATPLQSPNSPTELQVECTRAQREFRWKDAAQTARQANTVMSNYPLVSEAEFNEILARRVELGVPGAPPGYDSFYGYWQNFTAEEQQAYALITCTGAAEFGKFFPAPGTANAMKFTRQGFRAVAPAWSMLTSTTVLEETFASTSWSLLQQRGWDVSSREPYGLQASEIRPEQNNRKGVLYIDDEDSARAFTIKHFLQAMACGEASWDMYHLYTKPFGLLAGYDPLYLELKTDMGTTISVFIDNDFIYCNGLALAPAAEYTWYSFRVAWDCFAGTCAVWANGQLLRAGIPLQVIQPTTRPIIEVVFHTGINDVMGTAAIDCIKVTGEGGDSYLEAQRLGYWNTQPTGLILIPKSWFNLTQQAFAAKNQSEALLASIPLQTNIVSLPSWNSSFITLIPGKTTTSAIVFMIDGPDNPVVNVDLIAPPGITATFTPWVGFLHDLGGVNFTLNMEPGMYAGATYLLLNVSINGNVTAYQRVIPVRLAYEESSTLAIEQGPILVEPGSGVRWATLYNNGTAPQGYITTFAGLPAGWLHSDAYLPIISSTFDTGLGGWVGTCTSNVNLESKVHAYAGNLVMEAPQQAEQLSATLTLPAPIEVRPGDMVRLSIRGTCTGGLSLVAGQSLQVLGPGVILPGYKDVELAFTDFHTFSTMTITGSFNLGDNVWVDTVVLEACTTRHAYEAWQQYSDSSATLADYGWNVMFNSGVPEISEWVPVTNLAFTSAADPTINYGSMTTFQVGPGYNSFIQVPEFPAALLSYANLSHIGQYLYILDDPTFGSESTNVLTWVTGDFNETTSGSFPGVTWATQPSFTHILGNYSFGGGAEPAWIRIDATGRAWVGLNASTSHRFWSDEASDEDARPAVRFSIPKAGITGGYIVVQSDVADTFTLTLDLGKNVTMNAGDAIRLGFNVTNPVSLNITAGEFFAIDPGVAGHFEIILPFTTSISQFSSVIIQGALLAGGSFNLDFFEIYHVQPFGDVLGDITLGGVYNDTIPLDTFSGYSPLVACTFTGTTDGFAGACTAVNGTLFINASTSAPEPISVRRLFNVELPAGARVRLRACLDATQGGMLIIEGPGLNEVLIIPAKGPGNWQELDWTCSETSMVTWITLEVCLTRGEYLAIDYMLLEQPAYAQTVPYAVGRREVLPLKMVANYLNQAEIPFGGLRANGIWEGWIYFPFLGAELALTFLDWQRRIACRLTFNNTHLVVTNGTGVAVTTGDYSSFQHVQVAWDSILGNWSIKINNMTAFPVNYTNGAGKISLAPAIPSLSSLQVDIGDAGMYYLDGVQASWCANYTGSFIQSVSEGSSMAFWLAPGERRVFYMTPTSPVPDLTFLALFADAYTGQIRGVFDGTVISQPCSSIRLSSLSPVTQYCVIGSQVTFTLEVTNDGTLSDTFYLASNNYGEATCYLTPSAMVLAPGETGTANLQVSTYSMDINYLTVDVVSSRNRTKTNLRVVTNDVRITTIPNELSYMAGTTGNSFSWIAETTYVGNSSYSVTCVALSIPGEIRWNSTGVGWTPGIPVSTNIDGLPPGSYVMTLTISAGFGLIEATRDIHVHVLPVPPEPVEEDLPPYIQLIETGPVSCPVGVEVVVTAIFSDTGGSGLAKTWLYYTTSEWSSARHVLFTGDTATIPGQDVVTGRIFYFLYAEDAAGNEAYIDQGGLQTPTGFNVTQYTGLPYATLVVDTPVISAPRLLFNHPYEYGYLPMTFIITYPGSCSLWDARASHIYACMGFENYYRFRAEAVPVKDLDQHSILWFVEMTGHPNGFYLEVHAPGFDTLYRNAIGIVLDADIAGQDPFWLTSNPYPTSPMIKNIRVDRNPILAGMTQGLEFELEFSDAQYDMGIFGEILGLCTMHSIGASFDASWPSNYTQNEYWDSCGAKPLRFTAPRTVLFRVEWTGTYNALVGYYIHIMLGDKLYQAKSSWYNEFEARPDAREFCQNAMDLEYPVMSLVIGIQESMNNSAPYTLQCLATDTGGSGVEWLRIYYRSSLESWDNSRFVEFIDESVTIPPIALPAKNLYFYLVVKDRSGNFGYRCSDLGGQQWTYGSIGTPMDAVAQEQSFVTDLVPVFEVVDLPPEIGLPTITTYHLARGRDQVVTCPVADIVGSCLAWARVYYRYDFQAWDAARFVAIKGNSAIIPCASLEDHLLVEYYISASDSAGNIVYRGVTGCLASEALAREYPFSFIVGSKVPVFYKTWFQPASTMHLFPRDLGDDFIYTFNIQNVGNAPQEYVITTNSLDPHAEPSFNAPILAEGIQYFQTTLAPEQTLTFSLALSSIEPCLCNFTVIAASKTSGTQLMIPASFFINLPPVLLPAEDVIYEQATTGHALTWAISDTSPVPGKENWYGIYSNSTTGYDQFWATYTFDGIDPNVVPEEWFTDAEVTSGGRLTIVGEGSDEVYSSAWLPFNERLAGTVEWYNYPEYGIMEAGLFCDGVPIAIVSGGNLDGWGMDTCVNGITMGDYYNYMSITFDAIMHSFSIHACCRYEWSDTIAMWDYANIAFANDLVPNEFRVRVIGHMAGSVMGIPYDYAGRGKIDSLGLSWDPSYQVGDNLHVHLAQSGQFDPAGEDLTINVDGLLPDPVNGFADYKYVFLASDKWFDTGTGKSIPVVKDLAMVRVLTPEPVIVPLTGDLAYEYGTTGHDLGWQVLDVAAPVPTYEVWASGAEIPGQYQGTESFQGVPAGGIPDGWTRDNPTKVGVVDEWAGHATCLRLLSDDNTLHSAAVSFPTQAGGTVEWYLYWNMGGSLDVSFGDNQGSLAGITASSWNGNLYITPYGGGGYYWYPLPAGGTWHRLAFTFNAHTGAFSFTMYSPGCSDWFWNGHENVQVGQGEYHTWTGTFERQSSGVSGMQLLSTPGTYGQVADWFVDSIGMSWDPLYDVGDLVHLEREIMQVAGGTWTPGEIISVPVDGLNVGFHDYTFVARDGQGYATSKKATVLVYNAPPVLAQEPGDMTFLIGTLAPSLEWVLADHSTATPTYRILVDGSNEVASGTWVSGAPIAWNPSELLVGVHTIHLEIGDGLGSTLQDDVTVRANDQVRFIQTALDFSYHVGNPDFPVVWMVSDVLGSNPTYDLYVRQFEGQAALGDVVHSGSWSSGTATSILVNLGGMPTGMYLASMVVSDGLDSQATDQVVFYVTPEGMSPLDWLEAQLVGSGTGMGCGTSSGDVTVDVTFDTAEDTQVAIGIWDEPPQLEGPDFATPGIYFTVDAEKEASVTFPIYVTVTLPGGFPAGMTESDVVAWLRFLIFDDVSGVWVDPQFPIVGIDMAAGTAMFEVWHLSTFALGFANGLPPKIDEPGSFIYEYNAPGSQIIMWRLADLTVGPGPTYAIFRNGFLLAQGPWSFGTKVPIDASGLMIGTHDYEIIALDGLGGATSCHVPVTVYNVAPAVSAPADLTYDAGATGNTITWVPADISTGNTTCIITIDGIQVQAGLWTNVSPISACVDGLMPGSHVVDCTLADGLGLSAIDEVLVVVTNAEPIITAPQTITYEDGDPRPATQWIIEDSTVLAGTYDLFRGGTLVSSGAWASGIPLEINVGGLVPGSYTYRMVARDGYGAVNDATSSVTVLPDDDSGVTIATLNATATPFNVTMTFADVDPSGIASVDWVAVNGITIPNYTVAVSGGRRIVTFTHAFPRDGTYNVELQVTDADADRPGDAASQVFAVTVNVTGCDPIKSLMETVLVKIDLLQADIARVDCWLWRELSSFFAGRAETSMVKAFDLYLAGDVPAATVRVWVAQCALHVDNFLVQVGEMLGVINPDLATTLKGHVASIRADLRATLQMLGGAG